MNGAITLAGEPKKLEGDADWIQAKIKRHERHADRQLTVK
jgi:hypothetical protein